METVQTTFRQWEETLNNKTIAEAKNEENEMEEQTSVTALSLIENGLGIRPQDITKEMLRGMSGQEQHNLLQDLVPYLNDENLNNDVWNTNHEQINQAISNFLQQYGVMPSVSRLSKETGISRNCITKHLKEYEGHPQFNQKLGQIRFMQTDVVSKVLAQAVKGDLKAAKMYLEMMHKESVKQNIKKTVNQHNNYIQINGIVISQETLQQMAPEQLKQVETVFKANLPMAARG